MLLKQTKPVLISGNIVNSEGTSSYGFILVENGFISSVTSSKPVVPPGTIEYDAGNSSYIFPGFINLHTHVDYNLLPMWQNPYMYNWDNRFEWRNNAGYKNAISNPISYVRNNWETRLRDNNTGPTVGVAFQAMSEIQAVAGGTTVLQENTSIDEGCGKYGNRSHVLIRNTGTAADMGLPSEDTIDSQVDFYDPDPKPEGIPHQDTSSWRPVESYGFKDFLNRYQSGTIKGTLVHLAEGRSGAGLFTKGVDAYSRNEFNTFMNTINTLSPEQFNATNFGIIHGCGIDVWDDKVISFLKQYNLSLIWSPVSNMLLYGDTTFAPELWFNDVLTCLGSDWSPSGSKHVWEEAKYARFFFDALEYPVSNQTLYQMITTNPAKALKIPAGSIEAGNFADFFILNCDNPGFTPLEALFQYDDRDTKAVITAGVPVYGEEDLFTQWGIVAQKLPPEMGQLASTMYVNFPSELQIDVQYDFDRLEQLFRSQGVSQFSLPLIKDDIFYQSVIADLKKYTLWYAWQIHILPPNVKSARRK